MASTPVASAGRGRGQTRRRPHGPVSRHLRPLSAPAMRRRSSRCPTGARGFSPAVPQRTWRSTAEYAEWFTSQAPVDARLGAPICTLDSCLTLLRAAAVRCAVLCSGEQKPSLEDISGSPAPSQSCSPTCSTRGGAWGDSCPPVAKTPTVQLNGHTVIDSLSPSGQRSRAHSPGLGLSPNARPFVPSFQSKPAPLQTQETEPILSPDVQPVAQPPPPAVPLQSPDTSVCTPTTVPSPTFASTSVRRAGGIELPFGDPAQWPAASLQGQCVALAMDPEGSRAVQRYLEGAAPEEVKDVLDELLPSLLDVIGDVSGSHVLQRLLERGGPAVASSVVKAVQENVVYLAKQTYSCRILQRLLDHADEADRKQLLDSMEPSVIDLIEDQNGNHVIQKCLEIAPDDSCFIVKTVAGNVDRLACNAYGCRVVQRVLEHCNKGSEIVPILEEVLRRAQAFVVDQFGNYVVQHVIQNGHPQYRFAVTSRLRGNFAVLSTHKFASNVVEKMYEHATPQMRDAMLEELMAPLAAGKPGAPHSGCLAAATDQFGNYVIQKIFELSNEAQRGRIFRHLAPQFDVIRAAPYGRHLASRLERHDSQQATTERRPSFQQQQQQQHHHSHQHQHQQHQQAPFSPQQQFHEVLPTADSEEWPGSPGQFLPPQQTQYTYRLRPQQNQMQYVVVPSSEPTFISPMAGQGGGEFMYVRTH